MENIKKKLVEVLKLRYGLVFKSCKAYAITINENIEREKTNDNIFNRFCYRYNKHKQEYCWKDVTLYFLIDFVLFNEYLIYRFLKYLDNR